MLEQIINPIKNILFQYNNRLKQRHLLFSENSISKSYKKAPIDHTNIENLNRTSLEIVKTQIERRTRAVRILYKTCQKVDLPQIEEIFTLIFLQKALEENLSKDEI